MCIPEVVSKALLSPCVCTHVSRCAYLLTQRRETTGEKLMSWEVVRKGEGGGPLTESIDKKTN